MPTTPHFSREFFSFLAALRVHNDRDWFEANKSRYQLHVLGAMQRFVADLAPKLQKVAPGFVVNPKPVGGSLMRIYRDIRFSKDKTPYKTGMAAHFGYGKASDPEAAPAFYIHLEPGHSMAGGGLWRPPPGPLAAVRKRIAGDPKTWKRVTSGVFARRFELGGESLKKVPRGFPPENPCADDLKRKDFAGSISFTNDQVCSPGFLEAYLRACHDMLPFMRFLIDAAC